MRYRYRHRQLALIDRSAEVDPPIRCRIEPTDGKFRRLEVFPIRRRVSHRHGGWRVELRAVRAKIHLDVFVACHRDADDRVVGKRSRRDVKFKFTEIKCAAGAGFNQLRDRQIIYLHQRQV